MHGLLSLCRGVLTSTEDTVVRQKEHFVELLNPLDMPSLHRAVPEIFGVLEFISVAEVSMAIRILHSGPEGMFQLQGNFTTQAGFYRHDSI